MKAQTRSGFGDTDSLIMMVIAQLVDICLLIIGLVAKQSFTCLWGDTESQIGVCSEGTSANFLEIGDDKKKKNPAQFLSCEYLML